MKVLGICCGRKNGNTEMMMEEAFSEIERLCGASCQLVRLQEATITPCTGCESCMINHLKGNFDFRCVHKKESDHFYFIEQLMREADAIIVSAPAYNLLPPGILIGFLNKLHASGDYREVVHARNKIGAVFTIGGTDWTNFVLDACTITAMELVGSFDGIVDRVHYDFENGLGLILLNDKLLARMRTLGANVAEALMNKKEGEKPAYKGVPGVCPACHSNLLELREDGVYCPICLTKATLAMEDDELKVSFTEDSLAKSRWLPAGQALHDDRIRAGHKRTALGKDVIVVKRREYAEKSHAVKLPELNR